MDKARASRQCPRFLDEKRGKGMFDRAIFELDGIKPMMAVIVALTVARALAVVGQAVGLAQSAYGKETRSKSKRHG